MPGVGATLLAGCLDALLPRACALCGGSVVGPPRDDAICPGCAARLGPPAPLLPPPPPLAAAGTLGRYEGALREAIHLLKYARRGELAASLGRGLAAGLFAAVPETAGGLERHAVVPVPLHPRRLAERGFNQAALLARHLAAAAGLPLLARELVRVRETPAQASLDRATRQASVRGAFAVRAVPGDRAVAGRVCLLVDDVVTTGATAAACAEALLDAGAARVLLVALARA